MGYEKLGFNQHIFLTPNEAVREFGLRTQESLLPADCDIELEQRGIAAIEMPISDGDFAELARGFDICIDECPELLTATQYVVDGRFGNEAGYKRKDAKYVDGVQTEDPKSLIHFNELSRERWKAQFKNPPQIFKEFLDAGYEIHNALISVARNTFNEIDVTHPGLANSHFPGAQSCSYMRVLSYDDYPADQAASAEVAKPHYDIGGATIQAYADASGFWGAENQGASRTYFNTEDGQGYFFVGSGYQKLYGSEGRFRRLYHGVERIMPAGIVHIPRRHSVVLFIDSPTIDYEVTAEDTLPEQYQKAESQEQKIA